MNHNRNGCYIYINKKEKELLCGNRKKKMKRKFYVVTER